MLLGIVVFVVEEVQIGQHPIMQDSNNDDVFTTAPVEDHVPALFAPVKAWTNVIAWPAEPGIVRETLAGLLESIEIAGTLHFIPRPLGVFGDLQQIQLGAHRQTKARHVCSTRGDAQSRPYTGESVALCDAARIAFIDGSS